MPIFAVNGILTAEMIALAVLVSLLVLPSMLLFVTPPLKGEERERLEWGRTRGKWVYEATQEGNRHPGGCRMNPRNPRLVGSGAGS